MLDCHNKGIVCIMCVDLSLYGEGQKIEES